MNMILIYLFFFLHAVKESLLTVFYKCRKIKLHLIIIIVPSNHILTAPTHYFYDYSLCTLSATRQHLCLATVSAQK